MRSVQFILLSCSDRTGATEDARELITIASSSIFGCEAPTAVTDVCADTKDIGVGKDGTGADPLAGKMLPRIVEISARDGVIMGAGEVSLCAFWVDGTSGADAGVKG